VLAVRDWGRREYADALAEMRLLRRARRSQAIGDTLILVEHPAVVTVGVQGAEGEPLPDAIPVIHVERGGKATYHGPGQLVGYPIVDLLPRGRDVRRFVGDLEEVLLRSLAAFGIRAGRVEGRRGVWVEGKRKIASIGIAVEEWVTFHGFALNVGDDLAAFGSIQPCGMPASVMTSVSREAGRSVDLAEMRPLVAQAWRSVFAVPGPPAASVVPAAAAP
jgi:lipoate-protein ligase B